MLAKGSAAALFQVESSDGGQVGLRELAGKIAVLYFYPRDNTPGCTIEAQDFRDHLADFTAAGAVVYGVSRDSIASHGKFRDKYGLTFPLLSDTDGAMMQAYEAWGDKVMYGKKVTGALRSTVVLDEHGRVARHWPKVNVKGHAADVLAFVRSMRDGGAPSASDAAAPAAKPSPRNAASKAAKNLSIETPTRKENTMIAAKTPVKKAPAKTPVKKAPAKAATPAPAPAKTPVKKAAKTPVKKAPAKPRS